MCLQPHPTSYTALAYIRPSPSLPERRAVAVALTSESWMLNSVSTSELHTPPWRGRSVFFIWREGERARGNKRAPRVRGPGSTILKKKLHLGRAIPTHRDAPNTYLPVRRKGLLTKYTTRNLAAPSPSLDTQRFRRRGSLMCIRYVLTRADCWR